MEQTLKLELTPEELMTLFKMTVYKAIVLSETQGQLSDQELIVQGKIMTTLLESNLTFSEIFGEDVGGTSVTKTQ